MSSPGLQGDTTSVLIPVGWQIIYAKLPCLCGDSASLDCKICPHWRGNTKPFRVLFYADTRQVLKSPLTRSSAHSSQGY